MTDVIDVDQLPDGLVVADADGAVVTVNRLALRLLGIESADQVRGKLVSDVVPLLTSDGDDWWACIDPYGGLAIRSGVRDVIVQRPGTGDHRQLVLSAVFHRGPAPGRRLETLVLSLRCARARERAASARAELVSGAAHELRSPMASVKGFSRTLLTRWDRFSDEDRREMLGIIDSAIDRATRLIDELLDVSRLELGTLSVRPELVDVGELAARVVAGRVASGEEADRFSVDVTDDVALQWLDRVRMSQVVENLVDNAVRHGAGHVVIRVASVEKPPNGVVVTADNESYLLIDVCDEGGGVAPELRTRVFRRFWRGDPRSGTGLGLYFVKGIAEAHGGGVMVDTARDGGARFRVCVPSVPPPEPPTSDD